MVVMIINYYDDNMMAVEMLCQKNTATITERRGEGEREWAFMSDDDKQQKKNTTLSLFYPQQPTCTSWFFEQHEAH